MVEVQKEASKQGQATETAQQFIFALLDLEISEACNCRVSWEIYEREVEESCEKRGAGGAALTCVAEEPVSREIHAGDVRRGRNRGVIETRLLQYDNHVKSKWHLLSGLHNDSDREFAAAWISMTCSRFFLAIVKHLIRPSDGPRNDKEDGNEARLNERCSLFHCQARRTE